MEGNISAVHVAQATTCAGLGWLANVQKHLWLEAPAQHARLSQMEPI